MNELEELQTQLALAIKYNFDKKEIQHLQNLIERKQNENNSKDNINYPYGSLLV